MPLEIVRSTFIQPQNRGYCASQNLHYDGYKIHAVCSIDGVFKSFVISKASVHDIHYLNAQRVYFLTNRQF
jgi:phage terminase large subunit